MTQRIIKFRAWVDGKMQYGIQNLDIVVYNKQCILMQFTGLLDKNGKEIYISDYVKSANDEVWEIREGEWKKEFRDEEWKMFGLHLWNTVERNYACRET